MTFGVQVAVFYFTIALTVSIIAGYLLQKLGFEKFVKAEAYTAVTASSCGSSCDDSAPVESKWQRIWNATWSDFKKSPAVPDRRHRHRLCDLWFYANRSGVLMGR